MKLVGMNLSLSTESPELGSCLIDLGLNRFIGGMRVTDEETVDVVEMVLGASVNKEIVDGIHRNGGRAVGITGKDGELIRAGALTGHLRGRVPRILVWSGLECRYGHPDHARKR